MKNDGEVFNLRVLDIFIGATFLGLLGVLFVFIDPVKGFTAAHPFISGFIKVSVLATFGEYLRNRIMDDKWGVKHVFQTFFIWGLYGIWFTLAFPLISGGVEVLMAGKLWPAFGSLWAAFSKSLWINILSGFAYSMMLSHEYFHVIIQKQKLISMDIFIKELVPEKWGKIIPLSVIFFWLPAHTVTFMLPSDLRVMSAALLAVVLGFILSISAKKK